MQPSIGDIVIYRLTQEDAQQVNRRRTTGQSISERIRMNDAMSAAWPLGAQAHIGTLVKPGMDFPMIVVRVSEAGYISGQVFLEGNDVLWVTPEFGDTDGTWHWKPPIITTYPPQPFSIGGTSSTDNSVPRCIIHGVPLVLQVYMRPNSPAGNAWICPQCQAIVKETPVHIQSRRPPSCI